MDRAVAATPLIVAPSREDPLVARLSAAVGGAVGGRVRPGRHGWWTAARVLVVLAILSMSVAVMGKQHCRAEGWNTPDQFFHACYSDLPLQFQSSGIAQGGVPYVDSAGGSYLTQPVLTGSLMWAVGQVTPSGSAVERNHWYFDISTLVITGLLLSLVLLTAASAGRRRPWDAALVALSPLVVLSGLVSFDLLGVTLAAGGLFAWSRSRPLLAGLLLGAATTARAYPLILLLALAVLAARTGRWRSWLMTAGATVVTTLAVVGPWAALNAQGVAAFYRTWRSSGAGYGSIWLLPVSLPAAPQPTWLARTGWHPHTLSVRTVTTLVVFSIAAAVLLGLILALESAHRPRVAQVAFVMLAVVVITGKTWPVQASLWLLPLAALARPRWRDHLIWVACEATYWFAVWLYLAGMTKSDRGLPGAWYSLFLLVRVAGLLWLVWCVVQDIRSPDRDVVRADGQDDPLGGPFVGAPDSARADSTSPVDGDSPDVAASRYRSPVVASNGSVDPAQ